MKTLKKLLIGLTITPLLVANAMATEYPERPVHLVVPFAAGGPTDAIARIMAGSFEKQSGQPFVVENRSGAGSTIGTARVAGSTADGYTLLWGSSSAMVIAPHLYNTLQYDPFTSFEPIGMVAETPYVLLVNADSPHKTYKQLVEASGQGKNTLTYGTPGAGTSQHLTIELMAAESGFEALHIPFRGGAPAMMALIGKEVDFVIDVPSAAMPQIEAGKVRPLAVTSSGRLSELPDVPTMREEGLENFQSQAWFAMFAPKDTPEPILQKLRGMLNQGLQDQDVQGVLSKANFKASNPSADRLAETIQREHQTWGDVVTRQKITLQ